MRLLPMRTPATTTTATRAILILVSVGNVPNPVGLVRGCRSQTCSDLLVDLLLLNFLANHPLAEVLHIGRAEITVA